MVKFNAQIKKFNEQGEKTGWTYIEVPAAIAGKLKPGNKKSFRVKGKLDAHPITGVALLPMGGGDFIIPLNAIMRKAIRKQKGDSITTQLQIDTKEIETPADLLECLQDEPGSLKYFNSLAKSHQHYFIKWINSAKTEQTRAKRIALTVSALATGKGFNEMFAAMREMRDKMS